jgi:hypothetical protein
MKIFKVPVHQFQKFEFGSLGDDNGMVIVPLSLCHRYLIVSVIAAVIVSFTEGGKFQRKTADPYQQSFQKYWRSTALKMMFLKLLEIPCFHKFSRPGLKTMEGK